MRPEATQVADRFHLLCNIREALTRSLQRITPALRRVLARASAVASAAAPAPAMAQGTAEVAMLSRPRYGRSPRLHQE